MNMNKLIFVGAAFFMMISCDNNYLYSEEAFEKRNVLELIPHSGQDCQYIVSDHLLDCNENLPY